MSGHHAAGMSAADWHAIRAKHVGGSEVSALFDLDQAPAYAMSRYALWHIKAGNVPPPDVDNERVRWGLRLEEPIARGIAEDNGWTIERGGYVIDPEGSGCGATLDFVVRVPDRPDPGCFEIKNVDWLVHRRSWVSGEPPMHILLQHQHQMLCSGLTWGVVGGLVGGNEPHVYRYDARPGIQAEIRRRVRAFWQSIKDGREPSPDASDAASAVLRALYPDLRDEEADLTADNALPDICARLMDAAERRKAAAEDEALAKNELTAKLGNCTRALAQGFRINVAVTPEKPARPARADEIIPGRKEVRRIQVKELAA